MPTPPALTIPCPDVERREWRQLNPSGDWPPPAEKGLGWEHGGLIFLFGGYCQDGARLASSHQPFQVTQDPRTGGAWTNALVVYNPRWHLQTLLWYFLFS